MKKLNKNLFLYLIEFINFPNYFELINLNKIYREWTLYYNGYIDNFLKQIEMLNNEKIYDFNHLLKKNIDFLENYIKKIQKTFKYKDYKLSINQILMILKYSVIYLNKRQKYDSLVFKYQVTCSLLLDILSDIFEVQYEKVNDIFYNNITEILITSIGFNNIQSFISLIRFIKNFINNLSNLKINYCNIGDNEICEFAKIFTNKIRLKTLNLSCNQISDVGIIKLFKSFNNSSLLEIDLCNNLIGDEGAKIISSYLITNISLKEIDLSINQIGDDGAKSFGEVINSNCSLEKINFYNNRIESNGCVAIAYGLKNNKNLNWMDLSNNKIENAGAFELSNVLKINDNLKFLYLECCEITDEGAKAFSDGLILNNTLKCLGLNQNKIGNEGFKELSLVLNKNCSLVSINLSHNQIGNFGLNDVYNCNINLQEINLGKNYLGCQGAKHIASIIKNNSTLVKIHLFNNQIKCEGAIEIAESLILNKNLIFIDLGENQIKDKGFKAISNSLRFNFILKEIDLKENQIGDNVCDEFLETLTINVNLEKIYLRNNNFCRDIKMNLRKLHKNLIIFN